MVLVLEQLESKVVAKVVRLTWSPENCTAKSTLWVHPKDAVSKSVHELAEQAPPGRQSTVATVTGRPLPSNALNAQVWVSESFTPVSAVHAESASARTRVRADNLFELNTFNLPSWSRKRKRTAVVGARLNGFSP